MELWKRILILSLHALPLIGIQIYFFSTPSKHSPQNVEHDDLPNDSESYTIDSLNRIIDSLIINSSEKQVTLPELEFNSELRIDSQKIEVNTEELNIVDNIPERNNLELNKIQENVELGNEDGSISKEFNDTSALELLSENEPNEIEVQQREKNTESVEHLSKPLKILDEPEGDFRGIYAVYTPRGRKKIDINDKKIRIEVHAHNSGLSNRIRRVYVNNYEAKLTDINVELRAFIGMRGGKNGDLYSYVLDIQIPRKTLQIGSNLFIVQADLDYEFQLILR
ncbi:MAG: hypothetical protein JJ978_08945 [Roseivirga sp.]|uniref:hypothetical protein n=1 Tax=Roseivirga sp. TaxID=1964215 RepID=UPI001B28AA47|nr:hypothetical protein [Roseivirga sp.]MBO6495679.1 hypothetical protein [Roseivirga sp.]